MRGSGRRARRNMDATEFDAARFDVEESDPMSSLTNLVDAMLVFACGLMMAIVVRYNVDIAQIEDVEIDQELTEVEDIDRLVDEMQSGSGYTELGSVYQDPSTGKMYMITTDAAGNAKSDEVTVGAQPAEGEQPAQPAAGTRAAGAD